MTPISLIATALTLGLRHGVDWDHIAALLDIAGANSNDRKTRNAMILCLCYALGHALVVFAVGLAAIAFSAILPEWIDSVMERGVGITLMVLSGYLFFSIYQAACNPGDFKPQSRLMLFSSLINRVHKKLSGQIHNHELASLETVTAGGAFSIGMLHGFGAETGTQVLLITAVGRTGVFDLSIAMLVAFALGLVVSNSIIAGFAITGFHSCLRHRRVFITAGFFAGIFSLWLGLLFVAGRSDSLPGLLS
jgi:High-affinity nickel-transport protein.